MVLGVAELAMVLGVAELNTTEQLSTPNHGSKK